MCRHHLEPIEQKRNRCRGCENSERKTALTHDEDNDNTGYLEFTDTCYSVVEGRIYPQLLGRKMSLQAYKISATGELVIQAWSAYSGNRLQ